MTAGSGPSDEDQALPMHERLRRVRARLSHYFTPGDDVVAELLAMRREDNRIEAEKERQVRKLNPRNG